MTSPNRFHQGIGRSRRAGVTGALAASLTLLLAPASAQDVAEQDEYEGYDQFFDSEDYYEYFNYEDDEFGYDAAEEESRWDWSWWDDEDFDRDVYNARVRAQDREGVDVDVDEGWFGTGYEVEWQDETYDYEYEVDENWWDGGYDVEYEVEESDDWWDFGWDDENQAADVRDDELTRDVNTRDADEYEYRYLYDDEERLWDLDYGYAYETPEYHRENLTRDRERDELDVYYTRDWIDRADLAPEERRTIQERIARSREQARDGGGVYAYDREPRMDQERRQAQRRLEPTTLRGWVAATHSVNLQGLPDRYTVVRLELQNGRTAVVNLGPERDLRELGIEEGKPISVRGRVGTINDRDVLMAEALRVGDRTYRINLPKDTEPRAGETTLRGRIADVGRVTLAGQQRQHTLARLRLQNDRTAVVNFGPGAAFERMNLQRGDRVVIAGRRGAINDRPILMASEVRVEGRSYDARGQLDRTAPDRQDARAQQTQRDREAATQQREQRQDQAEDARQRQQQAREQRDQARQGWQDRAGRAGGREQATDRPQARAPQRTETLEGRIRSVSNVTVRNVPSEHTTLRVTLEDGETRLINFGPNVTRNELNLERGDTIRLRGRVFDVDGRQVFFARQARIDGETFTLVRPRDRGNEGEQAERQRRQQRQQTRQDEQQQQQQQRRPGQGQGQGQGSGGGQAQNDGGDDGGA